MLTKITRCQGIAYDVFQRETLIFFMINALLDAHYGLLLDSKRVLRRKMPKTV